MALNLNLKKDNSFWVNSNDEFFEDTDFEGMDFSVKVKPITKTQIRRFRKEASNNKGVLDDLKFSTLIFLECTIDWKNIEDDGVVLECTESNKRIIDERFPTFSAVISGCCLSNNQKQSEKLENEKKKS